MDTSTSSLPSQLEYDCPLDQDILTDEEFFYCWDVQLMHNFNWLNAILAQVQNRQGAEVDMGDVTDDGRIFIEP